MPDAEKLPLTLREVIEAECSEIGRDITLPASQRLQALGLLLLLRGRLPVDRDTFNEVLGLGQDDDAAIAP